MAGQIPDHPKIYHITHVDNLSKIAEQRKLLSDAKRLEMDLGCKVVGMKEIKRRRLEELEVDCHPGTKVGQYVPFYFCPRSIMLFILHRANHPDLDYRGGQVPIVHLEADLHRVVQWADAKQQRWAFCCSNAGARYTNFYNDLDKLSELDWTAVIATDFREARVKEGKQAEFLVFDSFPWHLVERIGVFNKRVQDRATAYLANVESCPPVNVEADWYF
jgi:hypothetical protein